MTSRSTTAQQRCASLAVVGTLCLLAGCDEPLPISFAEFMDDAIAREGTLARCNEDREATATDIECANARRAAAAIALREERARREALELESERKLAELRAQVEHERAATREAQLLAEAAARAAYEAQWEESDATPVGIDGQPIGADGLPIDAASPGDAGSAPIAIEPLADPLSEPEAAGAVAPAGAPAATAESPTPR